ncbi:hypothetical protein B0J13DRAFT_259406 [Dactylonectria estremocensis]|uniref:Uncharacterized protein n=1 Tax=Dactylonectria estremocensis TaxID=1079267 RepID=A0A9P9F3R1_9HYPO|nr:hypothetical protein B0J13DRAFT_259406 [Dactylonectria estremocensis]
MLLRLFESSLFMARPSGCFFLHHIHQQPAPTSSSTGHDPTGWMRPGTPCHLAGPCTQCGLCTVHTARDPPLQLPTSHPHPSPVIRHPSTAPRRWRKAVWTPKTHLRTVRLTRARGVLAHLANSFGLGPPGPPLALSGLAGLQSRVGFRQGSWDLGPWACCVLAACCACSAVTVRRSISYICSGAASPAASIETSPAPVHHSNRSPFTCSLFL